MLDGVFLGLFLLATFVGGLATGVAGFAMGLIVSGVWLHFLTPVQTAALIVGYTLLSQSYSTWKLRHALDLRKLAPFIAGGVVGVPAGALLLTTVDPNHMRLSIGVLLVIYSVYGLVRPALPPVRGNPAADAGIGFFNGLLGGLTGLGGIIVTIWCQLRAWPKDVQRAVFQPVIFAGGVLTVASFAVAGVITADTLRLYALGLPVLALGVWTGFKLYGRLDEAAFRKVVLWLLLFSGVSLVVPFVLSR
jgi:uncharacterized protein